MVAAGASCDRLMEHILGARAALPTDEARNRLFPHWKRQSRLDTLELI
jgi:hypothetical protein